MSTNMNGDISPEIDHKPSQDTHRIFPSTPDEEIVISGLAGRYPNSENAGELRENLFNKVCLWGQILDISIHC